MEKPRFSFPVQGNMSPKNQYTHLPSFDQTSRTVSAADTNSSYVDSSTHYHEESSAVESVGGASSYTSSYPYPLVHQSTSSPLTRIDSGEFKCGPNQVVVMDGKKQEPIEGLATESIKAVTMSASLVKDALSSFASSCMANSCKNCVEGETESQSYPYRTNQNLHEYNVRTQHFQERLRSIESGDTSTEDSSTIMNTHHQRPSRPIKAVESPVRRKSATTKGSPGKNGKNSPGNTKKKGGRRNLFGFLRRNNNTNKKGEKGRKSAIPKKPSTNPMRKQSLASNSPTTPQKRNQYKKNSPTKSTPTKSTPTKSTPTKSTPTKSTPKTASPSSPRNISKSKPSPRKFWSSANPPSSPDRKIPEKSLVTVTTMEDEDSSLYRRKKEVTRQSTQDNVHTIHVGRAYLHGY